MSAQLVFPLFVFQRRRYIEIEAGLILAGQLIVDIPKDQKPTRHQQQVISDIVRHLTAQAQAGQLPYDALVYGWAGGCRPANAVDVDDDALMSAWVKEGTVIGIRA